MGAIDNLQDDLLAQRQKDLDRYSRRKCIIGNGLFEEYAGGESPYYERMRSLLKLRARRPTTTGYFSNMLKDAVLCARDPNREPRSSARDGYLALRFIDAVKTAIGD